MKVGLRFVLFSAAIFFMVKSADAQLTSDHAVGARIGSASGITYRYKLTDANALEGILSVQSNSKESRFRLVGLYQYHRSLDALGDGFTWYWGFGGSLGSMTYKAYTDAHGNRIPERGEFALSIDGIVGIEYKIPEAPLAISLDVKPYIDFLQESSIRLIDPIGFSIRYTF